MKRRAVFGQWKTPPQVLYPSGSSGGMKKSTSMPVFSSMPPSSGDRSGNTDFQMSSSLGSQMDSPVKSQDPNNIRRSNSYQDRWALNRGTTGERDLRFQGGNKRNANGVKSEYGSSGNLSRAHSSGSVMGLSSDLGDDGSGHSDMNEADKRNKRLARNRASARMRRLRKKTIVETLEQECKVLDQSIAYLRQLQRENRFSSGAITGGSPSLTTEEQDLLVQLLGGEEEAHSISMARRRAAMQLFVDRQIYHAKMLQEDGLCNSFVSGLNIWSSTTNATTHAPAQPTAKDSLAAKRLTDQNYARALSYKLSSNLPVTEQEFSDRPRKSGSAGVRQLSSQNLSANQKPTYRMGLGSPELQHLAGTWQQSQSQQSASTSPASAAHSSLRDQQQQQTAIPRVITADQAAAERQALAKEFNEVMKLTDDQRQQLSQLSTGLQREQVRLDALNRVCVAMASHDWLEFPHLEIIISQFRGVLTAQQMNKFLVWSQRNSEAIQALPIIPSDPQAQSPPSQVGSPMPPASPPPAPISQSLPAKMTIPMMNK